VERLRKRLSGVMVCEVDGEVLLLDTESDLIHQLNGTASFIWRKCDEADSVEQIALQLAMEFDVADDTAKEDVARVLSQLRAVNVLE
jgi:Coenzyme PQQ synthesis protein D (PqqD)